jgi:hypothetical protein
MPYEMTVKVDSSLAADMMARVIRQRSRSTKWPYSTIRQRMIAAAASPVWWKQHKTSLARYDRVQRYTPVGLVLRGTYATARTATWMKDVAKPRVSALALRYSRSGLDAAGQARMNRQSESMGAIRREFSHSGQG